MSQEWVEVNTLKVDEGGRALITSQQLNVKLDFARFKIKVRRKFPGIPMFLSFSDNRSNTQVTDFFMSRIGKGETGLFPDLTMKLGSRKVTQRGFF